MKKLSLLLAVVMLCGMFLTGCLDETILGGSKENTTTAYQKNSDDLSSDNGLIGGDESYDTTKAQIVDDPQSDITEHIHNYSEASCVSGAECSCGDVLSYALGHNYVNGKCSRCGETDPDSLPAILNDLVVVDANPSQWYLYDVGIVKDSYGNTYDGYYEYKSDMFDPLTVNYNLGGKYKTFSCDMVAPDYTRSKAVLDILIYVDNKLVYSFTDYTKLTGLKRIEFDVTGGQLLTVKVQKTNDEGIANMYNTESVVFVNTILEK